MGFNSGFKGLNAVEAAVELNEIYGDPQENND